MRRTLAVGLCTGVLLVWWFCQDLSLKAQDGDEGQVPQTCVDINDDGETDIRDAVYLINYLFAGGPMPLACAQPMDLEARVSALEEACPSQKFGRRVAGTYFVNFGSPLGSFKGLLTVVSDGSVLLSPQTQYGHVAPAAFQSIFHGRWTRTDEFQLTVDTFMLSYGESGVPPSITGSDVVTWRWVWD